jgi:outer membrane protein
VKPFLAVVSGGLIAASVAAGAAHAQTDAPSDPQAGTVFGYKLNIALRGWIAPTYDGSKHVGPAPGGSLAVTKPSDFDFFAAPDDAASFSVLNTRHFSLGVAASVREYRGNKNELEGMRSIGWSIQGGGYLNYWPTPWLRMHAEALKGLTSQSGLQVNTSVDAVAQPGRWRLAAGPRFGWGDDKFNNTYFGVTPAEAIASPRIANPYVARAGAHFAGLEASAEYKWRRQWRLTFDARYHRLLGDDANSPLVRQLGAPDQFSVSTGVRVMLPN